MNLLTSKDVTIHYYGRQGVVIIREPNQITFSNPGAFRIEVAAAKSGGISDPRNSAILKMFNLIDIGERAGSGIPNIYQVWEKEGWGEPVIVKKFAPERIIISLSMQQDNKKSAINETIKMQIVEFLTDVRIAKSSEIAAYVGLKPSRTRDYLKELISEDIIVAKGANRNRLYCLK